MQNYEQILSELGIEVPEDKKSDLKKKMDENYKTINDYNNQKKKLETAEGERDTYKGQLDGVQEKLKGFENVNIEELRGKISTLETQLADEKTARAQDAQKVEREKTVSDFLSSLDENGNKKYEFLNDITEGFYRDKLIEELSKDSAKGKSIGDIFTGLITGEDGKQKANIFVDRQQAELEAGRAKPFTGPLNGKLPQTSKEKWQSMSLDERTKLKASDPAMYERLRKGE